MAMPTELDTLPPIQILRIEHQAGDGSLAVTIWLKADSGKLVIFKDGRVSATDFENPSREGRFKTYYLDGWIGWMVQSEVDAAVAYLEAIGLEVPDFLPNAD